MTLHDAPLGEKSTYPERYDPTLLFPVSRRDNRRKLGLGDGRWPWYGEDRWQAFELSWLAPGGLPQVAIAEFRVPADSPHLVESKSLKLYCNSLNQTVFEHRQAVLDTLIRDLSQAAGAEVEVLFHSVDEPVTLLARPAGYQLLEAEPITIDDYRLDSNHLNVDAGRQVTEGLCTHLLKSNCPVTGQPDWGTLLIDYSGPAIDRAGLLRYVVGFRQEQDFHEHCVERIFMDLMDRCGPSQLSVSAHYTRRGGLDINPWRSTELGRAPAFRLSRQ
ncbi:NADPH-dependent 7-cyano-7-deazaguanine reductase QueF [Marinobacteraceae bacterium S3BR75-40.1]